MENSEPTRFHKISFAIMDNPAPIIAAYAVIVSIVWIVALIWG